MMKQEFQDLPTSAKKKGIKIKFPNQILQLSRKLLKFSPWQSSNSSGPTKKKKHKTALECKERKIDTKKSRVCGLDVVVWSHHFSEKFLKPC